MKAIQTITELLKEDPLNKTRDLVIPKVKSVFKDRINNINDEKWLILLARFLEEPYSYWDFALVDKALELLNIDVSRSLAALKYQAEFLSLAIDNIQHPDKIISSGESLALKGSQVYLLIRDKYNPEYLKVSEHIWGNIIRTYWSVLKKKSVEGKFEIKSASTVIKNKGFTQFLGGYDDDVRNAIAHGKTKFTSLGIKYGSHKELTASDIQLLLDENWRTSISLLVAVIIFMAQNDINDDTPLGVSELLTIALTEREGLEINNISDIEIWTVGKQLHVHFRTIFSTRNMLLQDSLRTSKILIQNGIDDFDRFVFEIDSGMRSTSMLIINPKILKNGLENDLSIDDLDGMIHESSLLWYQGSTLRDRLKAWRIILKQGWQINMTPVFDSFKDKISDTYTVKEVKNNSSSGTGRIELYVVLLKDCGKDREILKRIAKDIVKKYKNKRFESSTSDLENKTLFPQKPKYIWIKIYREDGTARWLGAGGWMGKNMEAIVEWRRQSHLEPIFVLDPQEIEGNTLFQYEPNTKRIAEATKNAMDVVQQIIAKKKSQ